MATRALTYDKGITKDGAAFLAYWTNLTNATADVGAPLGFPAWGERTVQVFGTFGAGGNIVIEGSNDGANWVTLANRSGGALSFNNAALSRIQDYPVYVRPRVTAGDGATNLSVYVVCHRFDINEHG